MSSGKRLTHCQTTFSIQQGLEALERIRAHLNDLFDKTRYHLRNLVVIGNGNLLYATRSASSPRVPRGLTDILHPLVGDLTALDKMALIVITLLAAEQQGTVHAG